MPDATSNSAACHCGRPATVTEFAPNMDDYCDDCTLARCDITSAVDCPHYTPVTTAARKCHSWYDAGWYGISCDLREGHTGRHESVGALSTDRWTDRQAHKPGEPLKDAPILATVVLLTVLGVLMALAFAAVS